MGPTECPAPRQGWKQVVQESGRIDSSWLMSLNTFTYLRAHSLCALFYLDKKKRRGRGEVAVSMEKTSCRRREGGLKDGK